MQEELLALCFMLIREIDKRPFGFPDKNKQDAEDRNAVVEFAIHLIRYGHS